MGENGETCDMPVKDEMKADVNIEALKDEVKDDLDSDIKEECVAEDLEELDSMPTGKCALRTWRYNNILVSMAKLNTILPPNGS